MRFGRQDTFFYFLSTYSRHDRCQSETTVTYVKPSAKPRNDEAVGWPSARQSVGKAIQASVHQKLPDERVPVPGTGKNHKR